MRKAKLLKHWKDLEPKPLEVTAIPYKHRGSTFDQDGIRITGSPEFIDSVLSKLKEFLSFENTETRLQVAYQQAKDKQQNPLDSYSCYIQVHERGEEAKIMNALASGMAGKEVILSRGY